MIGMIVKIPAIKMVFTFFPPLLTARSSLHLRRLLPTFFTGFVALRLALRKNNLACRGNLGEPALACAAA
jgi:hypothetical protein